MLKYTSFSCVGNIKKTPSYNLNKNSNTFSKTNHNLKNDPNKKRLIFSSSSSFLSNNLKNDTHNNNNWNNKNDSFNTSKKINLSLNERLIHQSPQHEPQNQQQKNQNSTEKFKLTSVAPQNLAHPSPHELESLARIFQDHCGSIMALTGAGLSTESGIPDYRSPGRPQYRPMQHNQFTSSPSLRRRYWARSSVGYERIRTAEPNPSHYALAKLEHQGYISNLVTQNVDGLHRKAGSIRVDELHGDLHFVKCLGCSHIIHRDEFQAQLMDLNPDFSIPQLKDAIRPDGDIELQDVDYDAFRVPDCHHCGGVLMPDIVFFGGSISPEERESAMRKYRESSALVVWGSSLPVWSAMRFVRAAHQDGKPIAIVNYGPTRGDDLATVKINASVKVVLLDLLEYLKL
eukprot:gb/GECH01004251.1/.p1 GENE.gb/GECH01004251.1/~~gb/GECH01004251.1/.p1  ORF type:complete len:401 (+),score=108.38 gb/GECH01004251.1/:1-1203(+)